MAFAPASHQQRPIASAEAAEAHKSSWKLGSAVLARTVDPTGPYLKLLRLQEASDCSQSKATLSSDPASSLQVLPPVAYDETPVSSWATKLAHVTQGPSRVNVAAWWPDGRRCLTGFHNGSLLHWDGSSFQYLGNNNLHGTPVRCVAWAHHGRFFLCGDGSLETKGKIIYWSPSLQHLRTMTVHEEAVQAVCLSPTDNKFATACVDGTIKIWDTQDLLKERAEQTLMGHGGDILCADWHPRMSMIASGSKDTFVKLWDPRSGQSLGADLRGHNQTVTSCSWNHNGNWLLTTSRDTLCKVWEVRMQRVLQDFKGHNEPVITAAWHPKHEEVFASGAQDGSITHWLASQPDTQARVQTASPYDQFPSVLTLAWHPLGHLLCSGSADACIRFWCCPRPGDPWWVKEDVKLSQSASQDGNTAEQGVGKAAAADGSIPGIGAAALMVAKPEAKPAAPPRPPSRPTLENGMRGHMPGHHSPFQPGPGLGPANPYGQAAPQAMQQPYAHGGAGYPMQMHPGWGPSSTPPPPAYPYPGAPGPHLQPHGGMHPSMQGGPPMHPGQSYSPGPHYAPPGMPPHGMPLQQMPPGGGYGPGRPMPPAPGYMPGPGQPHSGYPGPPGYHMSGPHQGGPPGQGMQPHGPPGMHPQAMVPRGPQGFPSRGPHGRGGRIRPPRA